MGRQGLKALKQRRVFYLTLDAGITGIAHAGIARHIVGPGVGWHRHTIALEQTDQRRCMARFRLADVEERPYRTEIAQHLIVRRQRPVLVVEGLREGLDFWFAQAAAHSVSPCVFAYVHVPIVT